MYVEVSERPFCWHRTSDGSHERLQQRLQEEVDFLRDAREQLAALRGTVDGLPETSEQRWHGAYPEPKPLTEVEQPQEKVAPTARCLFQMAAGTRWDVVDSSSQVNSVWPRTAKQRLRALHAHACWRLVDSLSGPLDERLCAAPRSLFTWHHMIGARGLLPHPRHSAPVA